MNTIQQRGDEMVEVFGPYMAIEHCKRVIEELEELDSNMKKFRIVAKIQKYRLILSELEGRVK